MIELKCNRADILEGKLKILSSRDHQICLTILNSEILAFEDICSHDGESFGEGKIEDGCIVCPRHLAKFELRTGKAICMPATEDIRIFPVKIVGQEIIVEIED